MLQGKRLVATLKHIATRRLASTLARRVPLFSLIQHKPMQFLYTSGRPNRFNLETTSCLYFSENERTAIEEWKLPLVGLSKNTPCVTFFAKVHLSAVLNLDDAKVRQKLALSEDELFAEWSITEGATSTQLLGQTVAEHTDIVAIRYPSYAARLASFRGVNVVIFCGNLVAEDFVAALGDKGEVIEQIPQ